MSSGAWSPVLTTFFPPSTQSSRSKEGDLLAEEWMGRTLAKKSASGFLPMVRAMGTGSCSNIAVAPRGYRTCEPS